MSKAIEQITPTRRGALGALAASVAGVSIAACAVATSEAAAIGENDARLRAIYAAWLASWRKSEADDARHDAIVREVVPADILAERERRSAMIKADPAGYFDTLEDFKARSLPTSTGCGGASTSMPHTKRHRQPVPHWKWKPCRSPPTHLPGCS